MRVRTVVAAVVVLAAGSTLTACQGDGTAAGDKTAGSTASAQGGTPTSSASASATGSGSSVDRGSGGSAKGGDGTIAACSVRTTSAAFVAATRHATQSRPATGTVKITNTSA